MLGLLVVSAAVGGAFFAFRDRFLAAPPNSLVEIDEGAKGDKPPLVEEKDKDEPPIEPKREVPPRDEKLARKILAMLNDQRKRERLAAVALNEEACEECAGHAAHLVARAGVADLDPHDRDEKSGSVATARAASVVYQEPFAALKVWLQAPAHRSYLMDPELTVVAFGWARTKSDGWVSVFDWVRGRPAPAKRGSNDPIVYPNRGQHGVPLSFPGNEIPDPLPNTKDKLAGFPITVTFPGPARVPDSRAWLEDEAGNEVAVWYSSPTKPANDKFVRSQNNTICLFARKVLKPGMRYVVKVEARVGTREWVRTWTFTTESPAESRRLIYTRALDRLNHFRKVSGLQSVTLDPEISLACLAHSGYLARHFERVEGVRLEDEMPELAGFTEEGKKIAKRATFRLGGGSGARDAIDWLMISTQNRFLALNPSMKTLGMGAAQQAPRGWVWTIALPLELKGADFPDAILSPGKGQEGVPLLFGRDITPIVPGQKADAAVGYGVTASFFPRRSVTNAKATLSVAGTEVACWLSSPEKQLPATGGNVQILLIPKQPLKSKTTYSVEMSADVDGGAWAEKWQFTTLDGEAYREGVAGRLLAHVNQARKDAGLTPVTLDAALSGPCQKHADYVVRNLEHPKVQGLGIHDEDSTLPGASKDGTKAGKAAVIAIISEPADSVAGWMATLYHRIPILDPELKRVGYGQTQHAFRGWVTVLDTGNGK